jgi:hypothetical protein
MLIALVGTLADRMLEMTGTIPLKQKAFDQPDGEMKNEQVLDTLKVEKERGITVRLLPFPLSTLLKLTLPPTTGPRPIRLHVLHRPFHKRALHAQPPRHPRPRRLLLRTPPLPPPLPRRSTTRRRGAGRSGSNLDGVG